MIGTCAGQRMADLLLPYCIRELLGDQEPEHELGWWFTDAPPPVAREALALAIDWRPGQRPNEQPPEEWLIDQAELRGGVVAGFACPAGPMSPRMRVDAIIVPCAQADDLAVQIGELWSLTDSAGTALDLAEVEGFAAMDAQRHLWVMSGSEFRPWRAEVDDWLGATLCSFWWD
jgi:hypothetical protein